MWSRDREYGGGTPGGIKPTFMSVDRGLTIFYFTASAYLLCTLDRLVLLILVLFIFMQEIVLLDEWLNVPYLSCGTRSFGPPPLNNTFVWSLPIPVTPHESWANPSATLESPLSLLESMSPKPPSPDPLHVMSQSKIEYLAKTSCMPGNGLSRIISSGKPMLLLII